MDLASLCSALMPDEIFEPALVTLSNEAVSTVIEQMSRYAPFMASRVEPRIRSLSQTDQAADCFRDMRSFMLLFPWLFEKSLRPEPDHDFQADVALSSVNGYYFIRFIDNVMDGHAAGDMNAMPALGFFHTGFQTPYMRYFPADSGFWQDFQTYWNAMAEATVRDAAATQFSMAAFREISAEKLAGMKVPLAAVGYRYDKLDLLPLWYRFFDSFACFTQMLDDLFDWFEDSQKGRSSYILTEGVNRKRSDESAATWMVREGFFWGVDVLWNLFAEMRANACILNSAGLEKYVDYREQETRTLIKMLTPDLQRLAKLADILDPQGNG